MSWGEAPKRPILRLPMSCMLAQAKALKMAILKCVFERGDILLQMVYIIYIVLYLYLRKNFSERGLASLYEAPQPLQVTSPPCGTPHCFLFLYDT